MVCGGFNCFVDCNNILGILKAGIEPAFLFCIDLSRGSKDFIVIPNLFRVFAITIYVHVYNSVSIFFVISKVLSC